MEDAADVTAEETRGARETPAPVPLPSPHADIPAYDTTKYLLGQLCPRGHDYQGTGLSLRHLRRHVCLACDAEAARERRKARAHAKTRAEGLL